MRLIVLVGCAVLATAGCAHSGPSGRAVLRQGVTFGASNKVHRVNAKEALRAGRSSRAYFEREVRVAARKEPGMRFDSPPRADLLARLRHESAEHHFRIVSLRMLHPDQRAPMVIVSTTRYESLARAGSDLLTSLNGRSLDRYEGFYLEARDERGVPFFTTYTLRRDRSEGGVWARSDALYPVGHF
jgi:hypothetical protein